MIEADGGQPGEQSRDDCHADLFKLRVALTQTITLLYEYGDTYYYLCEVVEKSPTRSLEKAMRELIEQQGRLYVDKWKEVIDIGRRADAVLSLMERLRQAEVERSLDELEL